MPIVEITKNCTVAGVKYKKGDYADFPVDTLRRAHRGHNDLRYRTPTQKEVANAVASNKVVNKAPMPKEVPASPAPKEHKTPDKP